MYKRQEQRGNGLVLDGKRERLHQLGEHGHQKRIGGKRKQHPLPGPVSYTHLDVYKRQQLSLLYGAPSAAQVNAVLQRVEGAGFAATLQMRRARGAEVAVVVGEKH